MTASQEERFIAQHFEKLSARLPGAFSLKDDCAELVPAPGQAFIVKTDPVVEGLHFLADDDPADVAYKALAVNVSDLAAKAARPFAYLLAIGLPERPEAAWMERFTAGLAEAQEAFGMTLAGGDTDRISGPASIAVTVFGECPVGRMVPRGGARPDLAATFTLRRPPSISRFRNTHTAPPRCSAWLNGDSLTTKLFSSTESTFRAPKGRSLRTMVPSWCTAPNRTPTTV